MRTLIETQEFRKQADTLWIEEERLDLISWLAANPTAGTLIPGAGAPENCAGKHQARESVVVPG